MTFMDTCYISFAALKIFCKRTYIIPVKRIHNCGTEYLTATTVKNKQINE